MTNRRAAEVSRRPAFQKTIMAKKNQATAPEPAPETAAPAEPIEPAAPVVEEAPLAPKKVRTPEEEAAKAARRDQRDAAKAALDSATKPAPPAPAAAPAPEGPSLKSLVQDAEKLIAQIARRKPSEKLQLAVRKVRACIAALNAEAGE